MTDNKRDRNTDVHRMSTPTEGSASPDSPEPAAESLSRSVEAGPEPPAEVVVLESGSSKSAPQAVETPSDAKFLGKTEQSRRRQLANLSRSGRKAVRPEILTREDVFAVLREIVADPSESGAYRVAASRLLLTPEGVEVRCPLPCCANRTGNVLEWIESMAEADKIAPRKFSPEIEAWLDGIPDENEKGS